MFEKILNIITGAERIPRPVPEDDTRVVILGRLFEYLCESEVHGRCHRVPLCRAVQLDPQNTSSAFGNNLVHCRSPDPFG